MDKWLPFFVAVTALAVVVQVIILAALLLSVRRAIEKLSRTVDDLHQRLDPILLKLRILTDDAQPRITAMIANIAEITEVARGQARKVDRVFTEAVDRLRLQVIRADQILTGALESIEEAGSQVKRTLWEPMQRATAVIRGIKAGLDFMRDARAGSARERPRTASDDELFI
jgi:uncharacterized protein YoxC